MKTEQKKVKLKRGYYALRLIARDESWITVSVGAESNNEKSGFDILGDFISGRVCLSRKNPLALIMVYNSSAVLEMQIFMEDGNVSSKFAIDVERISHYAALSCANASPELSPSLVHLSGHLEGVGDINVNSGQWLGKKTGLRRVEGFCIHWDDKPNDIDLIYGCLVTGNLKTAVSATGGFVGSRQRAASISGLWVDIKGANRCNYELNFKVAFSRSGVLTGRKGKLISGLGINDHVVGLNVNLRAKEDKMNI